MVHYCIYECPPPFPVLSGVQIAFGKQDPCRNRFLMLSVITSIWHTFLFSSLKMKSHRLFMQGSAHTGNKSHKYFTWNFWCVGEGLWHVCLPDWNPHEFYSWGFEVKCCDNSKCWEMKENIQQNIQHEISHIPRWQCHYVSRNVFPRCGTCIIAGQHFGTFLWSNASYAVREKWTVNNELLMLCSVESCSKNVLDPHSW